MLEEFSLFETCILKHNCYLNLSDLVSERQQPHTEHTHKILPAVPQSAKDSKPVKTLIGPGGERVELTLHCVVHFDRKG